MSSSAPRTPTAVRALLTARTRLRDADRAAVLAVIAARGVSPMSLVSDRALVDQAARLLERPEPVSPSGGWRPAPVPLPPVEAPPPPPVAEPTEPVVEIHRVEVHLRDPWEGTGREPPPVGRRTHARHHRFRGSTTVNYAPYYGGDVSDPVRAMSGAAFTAPARERQPARFTIDPMMFHEIRGLFLWAYPTGSAALLGPDSDLAVGRLYVPRSQMRSRTSGDTATLSVEVEVVDGVAGYMAAEMRRNAVAPVTAEIARLNSQANAIYADHLVGVVRATRTSPSGAPPVRLSLDDRPLTALDLATASTRHPLNLPQRGVAVLDNRPYDLDYLAARFRAVGAQREVRHLERYHDLKSRAFDAWGEKVRMEPFGSVGQDVRRRLLDLTYGDGDWDHKPTIFGAWGSANRLGNEPLAYGYDIWSNMHYGYVGRAAGFSIEELIWGSDVAQRIDTGAADDPRDPQAIREGFRLNLSNPAGVDWRSLVAVAQSHGAAWAIPTAPAARDQVR